MNNSKKETLIKILTSLIPYRSPAEWFLILIENNEDEALIDALYDLITKEIRTIKNNKNMNDMKEALNKIKEKEEANSEWYKYLEDLIDNL